ncbi:Class E basic helix-loop-helix protein 41 [Pteropus alecto]|uniref:Class E basic helix-loop-helix protein 40 n=1 Tax=Pteropus alecto TaxID=9402 RepID=L5KN51_PTEAL|nr:Class E basic helix-loop-helix protein 41 [Pteropus alecto]
MDEGIPHLQERQLLEHRDFIGLDYSSLYMCKPKRSMKRDDSKDTYKLPHRLIEKKRRDRINECIAQLKDLLPEHLKLTTLGHLEKAVVLELTLKHLKALTALTEQQHQKIIALQNGERSLKSPIQSDLDAFHSGFQTCAKEVLQYLSRFESWTPREPRCIQLINHLHAVATQFLPTPQLLTQQVPLSKGTGAPSFRRVRSSPLPGARWAEAGAPRPLRSGHTADSAKRRARSRKRHGHRQRLRRRSRGQAGPRERQKRWGEPRHHQTGAPRGGLAGA